MRLGSPTSKMQRPHPISSSNNPTLTPSCLSPTFLSLPSMSEHTNFSAVSDKTNHNTCVLTGSTPVRTVRTWPIFKTLDASQALYMGHGGRRQPMCDPEGCSTVWGAVGGGGTPTPPFVDPNPAERGTESEVAHKWARWLHNPCRLGDPHRFRAGGRIRGGPQVGKVAT